jgi:DNA-binding transcriptional LysR family regulator
VFVVDIKHLRYFIAVVENDFNLSRTAESLYISQPTLSIMINDFEARQGIKLFNREQSKLLGLTLTGKHYYQDALEVIKKYNDMQENLHRHEQNIKGAITIGIPPLVLSVVFSTIMPKLILKNPDIQFTIKESGAYQLRQDLLLETVDIAILLHPEGISKKMIDSYQIQSSELAVFMSTKHRLANHTLLDWPDLHNEKMAIFDETFMIHHLVKAKFEQHNIRQNIVLQSGSWDFLVNSARINHELLSILPLPIAEQYSFEDIVAVPIKQAIPWKVMLCRLKKSNYNRVEEYILDALLEEFDTQA